MGSFDFTLSPPTLSTRFASWMDVFDTARRRGHSAGTSVLFDGPRSRTFIALGGALVLHVLAIALTLSSRRPLDAAASGGELARLDPTIEIELAEDASSTPQGEAVFGNSSPESSVVGSDRSRGEHRPSKADTNGPPAPVTGAGDYAVDPGAQGPGSQPRVDLGIAPGDWSRWTNLAEPGPETKAPRRAPAPVSTTGGLAEALEAHDQEVGLGPAGAVLSAARDAGHSDIAPQLGTATFAVTVLRTGVVDVQLTGASSNVDGWQKVAASMAAAIRRRPPTINPPRNGVHIGIELVADERWPNGAPARSEGPSVAVTGFALHTVDEAKEDLARRNPAAIPPPGSPVEQPSLKANVELPGVFIQGRGKVCSYKIGVTPFGLGASGGCDPANIGAPPQRVVSTRVTSDSMF